MEQKTPIGYKVYENVYVYLQEVKKYKITEDKTMEKGQLNGKPNNVKEYKKTMQFHQYIRIKAINGESNILYVFIINDPLYVSRVSMFIKLLNTIKEKTYSMLLISKEDNIKNSIKSYDKKNINFRYLSFNYFKIDPRKHILVPKHKLCSPEKISEILSHYHLDDVKQFSQIKYDDPQVVWVDGEVGDVIEIEEINLNSSALKYRIVIP